jgi:hypothetical protein
MQEDTDTGGTGGTSALSLNPSLSSLEVRYVGVLPLDGEDKGAIPQEDSLPVLYGELKRRSASEEKERTFQLSITMDGLRIVVPTGSTRRPFALVMHHPLAALLSVAHVDRAFVFAAAPTRTLPRSRHSQLCNKVYAFKCADKKMVRRGVCVCVGGWVGGWVCVGVLMPPYPHVHALAGCVVV